MHPQLVVNQRPWTHLNRGRRKYDEVQPRWRDGLQIPGIRKEIEDDLPRPRQPEFALEQIWFHLHVAPGLDLNWLVANMAV